MNNLDKKKTLFNEWAKTYDQDVENAGGPLDGYQDSLSARIDKRHVMKSIEF